MKRGKYLLPAQQDLTLLTEKIHAMVLFCLYGAIAETIML